MFDINKLSAEDLTNAPLKDLLTLQAKLNKAIEIRRETERAEVFKKIHALASESGFDLNELLGTTAKIKKPKSSSTIQYVNPNNPSEGWTGKGRKPNWLVALLASGKELKDFAI